MRRATLKVRTGDGVKTFCWSKIGDVVVEEAVGQEEGSVGCRGCRLHLDGGKGRVQVV